MGEARLSRLERREKKRGKLIKLKNYWFAGECVAVTFVAPKAAWENIKL
jgi:hypothetical protein